MAEFHLFHIPGACSRVTLSALEMTGAPYQVSVVPIFRGGLVDPEFLSRSPVGQVPTLLVDGKPFTENLAILMMLHRLYPMADILPVGDVFSDTVAISRLSFCSSQLHPIVTRIMLPEKFCDSSEQAPQRVRELAVTMLLARLATVEGVLAEQAWWLGDNLSIADVYLFWVTARMLRLHLDFSKLPALATHADRVRFSPLMTRVLAQEAQFAAELEQDGTRLPERMKVGMAL